MWKMNTHKPTEFEFSEQSENFKEIQREFSKNGECVVVIGKRTDGNFTYACYKWDLSEIEYIGNGYWCPCGGGSIFESIESATNEALSTLDLCI